MYFSALVPFSNIIKKNNNYNSYKNASYDFLEEIETQTISITNSDVQFSQWHIELLQD